MSFAYEAAQVVITLDEFSGVVAVGLYRRELSAEAPLTGLIGHVRVRRSKDGAGLCTVEHTAVSSMTPQQRSALETVTAGHAPGDVLDGPQGRGLADLTHDGPVGAPQYLSTVRRERGGPNELGTLVYMDHELNWRRVSDDEIVKAAP